MIMITSRFQIVAGLAVAAILGWSALGLAQAPAPGKPKDDALEDLLKQAEAGSKPRDSAADKAKAKDKKDDAKKDAPKKDAAKPTKPGELSTKDKELDDLLGKATEKDTPSADDKKSEPPPSGAEDKKPDKADDAKGGGDKDKKASKPKDPLKGDDAELDNHLAGKKEKKPGQKKGQGQGQGQGQGEEDGPLGDLIKQMREVEQRLGKPDTGEETRQKQTEIVKKLDTMIEQMRTRQVSMRQMRQGKPGQPGQPGQQPGAMAQGAPPMKPEMNRVTPLGLKDKNAWGHLQQALRDEMDNVFKEKALPSREDLIKRYYMAVAKKSLSKGE
jgi:hypothetical protein